jgi:hypothetical protein
MQRGLTWFSGALKLALLAGAGLLLAGCVIVSKTPLVTESEGVAVLPATLYLFSYNEDPAGYLRGEDPPGVLKLDGTSYTSEDGTMSVRFVPLDTEATYLAAVESTDGNMYGIARYRDSILAINIILSDAAPGDAIEAEKASGAAGSEVLKDVTVEDGGITVTTREALDYLVAMHLAGKLPMAPLVTFIGESADASAAPAKLVQDGDFWKAEG